VQHGLDLPLDVIMQVGLDPAVSVAIDRTLLDETRDGTGALRVYDLAGPVLGLGRYHLAPAGDDGVVLHRRLSGGRVVPAGDGFVALSLVLPHRSALVSADPLALAPAQVMNRCVRGILEGLKTLGAGAFYPGRDTITVGRRIAGFVSFEVDRHGVLLFEAVLARSRDFGCLPRLLDAADPAGTVAADVLDAGDTITLAQALGREVGLDELAAAMRRGYEARFGVRFHERSASRRFASEGIVTDPDWVRGRRRDPALDRRATTRGQLGVLEVHFALAGDRLGPVLVTGDFIASSPAIERLEHSLPGCPAAASAIDAVVRDAFAPPGHFILGIGSPGTITDTIVRGLPA
jgi:lipoate-protein ligase A